MAKRAVAHEELVAAARVVVDTQRRLEDFYRAEFLGEPHESVDDAMVLMESRDAAIRLLAYAVAALGPERASRGGEEAQAARGGEGEGEAPAVGAGVTVLAGIRG